MSTRQDSSRPRSSFFIVGAPRCGTTSLSKALARHPDVCFSDPKETHFFVKDFDGRAVDIALEYLDRFFPHRRQSHKTIGEGSVSYLYAPDAIQRVLTFDPNARFIAMVRNPVELVPSYHARMLFTLDENEPDLSRAWALQEERARGRQVPPKCRDPRLLLYGEVGRLGSHVGRLLELVPPASCRVIVFDDLAQDPIGVYRKVLDFLQIRDDGRTEFPNKNSHRAFRHSFLQQFVTNPPSSIRKILRAESLHTWERRRWLMRAIRRRIKQRNTIKAERRAPDPAVLQMLRNHFRDDVARLSALLRRDLGHWLATGSDATRESASSSPARAREQEAV
ncbi:MAG: sulfotransferase family protein [Geminicoccaceae bacterium]